MKKQITDEWLLLEHIFNTYKPSDKEDETNYWNGQYYYWYEMKDYVNPFKL